MTYNNQEVFSLNFSIKMKFLGLYAFSLVLLFVQRSFETVTPHRLKASLQEYRVKVADWIFLLVLKVWVESQWGGGLAWEFRFLIEQLFLFWPRISRQLFFSIYFLPLLPVSISQLSLQHY